MLCHTFLLRECESGGELGQFHERHMAKSGFPQFPDGYHKNAVQASTMRCHKENAKLLTKQWADPNVQGWKSTPGKVKYRLWSFLPALPNPSNTDTFPVEIESASFDYSCDQDKIENGISGCLCEVQRQTDG